MDFHILTTHQTGRDDGTPLQMISAEQLAHYKAMEAAALAFVAALAAIMPQAAP